MKKGLYYKRSLKSGKKKIGAKTKKPPIWRLFVIPLGLEPRAHTLKVYCSTN